VTQHRDYLERFFSREGPAEAGVIDHYYGCGDSLLRRAALPDPVAPFAVERNHIGGEDDMLFGHMQANGARFAWEPAAWVWEDPVPDRLSLDYTIRRAFAYGQGPLGPLRRRQPARPPGRRPLDGGGRGPGRAVRPGGRLQVADPGRRPRRLAGPRRPRPGQDPVVGPVQDPFLRKDRVVSIISDWTDDKAKAFGRENLVFQHGLHERPMFDDEGLARLLDQYPRDQLGVFTMGEDPKAWTTWRKGAAGNLTGDQLLEAAKTGRIWLNLRHTNDFVPEYAALCDEIFAEKEARAPGLKTFKRDLGMLISSADAQVFYHLDVPLVSLWQIRGRKKVWVYPVADPYVGDWRSRRSC
jgi:hypothetical protein